MSGPKTPRDYIAPEGMPPFEDLLFHIPLYRSFVLNESHSRFLGMLHWYRGTCDAYCLACERDTTFQGVDPRVLEADPNVPVNALPRRGSVVGSERSAPDPLRDRTITVALLCTRSSSHTAHAQFTIRNSELIKVGEFPSVADLEEVALKKYRDTLTQDRYREFAKAVG
jgi:hypothetical protein